MKKILYLALSTTFLFPLHITSSGYKNNFQSQSRENELIVTLDSDRIGRSRDVAKLIDCYKKKSIDDEESRLDNLTKELIAAPNSTGYIIRYRGKKTTPGQFNARRIRIENWLFNIRKFNIFRINIINGAVRLQDVTELWKVPAGAAAPKPSKLNRCTKIS